MRRLALILAFLTLDGDAISAQSPPSDSPRWETGLSTLFGMAPLVGGTLAFRALTTARLHLAVELSGYRPLFSQREWACVQASDEIHATRRTVLSCGGNGSGQPAQRRMRGVSVGVAAGEAERSSP